jgi:hypothetical protein
MLAAIENIIMLRALSGLSEHKKGRHLMIQAFLILGAPGGIIRRVHAPQPSGGLWPFKIAPGDFIEQRFSSPTRHSKHKKTSTRLVSLYLVRPEGFEPPTNWFEANYSIQLSYGRIYCQIDTLLSRSGKIIMQTSQGFDKSFASE